MKKIFTILFALFPALLISQEIDSEIKELSNKIVPEFCGCLQEYQLLDGDKFGNCFGANIQKYEEELLKFYIDDTTQVAQKKNDQFIFDLFAGMQEKLFNECEEYYVFIKNLRDTGHRNLMAVDVETKLDSMNNIGLNDRNSDYHFRKGVLFFAKKQYPQAKDEILKGLETDPQNTKYKVLLGWIYEEQNNTPEALRVFDELVRETPSIEYVMLREFTKRNFQKPEKVIPDCSKFHTGKFKIVSPDDLRTVIIERTKDLQIETQLQDKSVTKMSVEWVDDCNYILRYIESTNPKMDEYAGTELRIKIMETTNDSFKFKATMEGVDYIMIEEMVQIK